MKLYQKLLIVLGIMSVVGLLVFIVYQQRLMAKQTEAINTQMVAQKKLADDIVRSQSEYATKKDIDQFIKDQGVNLKTIQDDMKTLHAEIAAVNVVTVVSNPQHAGNIPSTNTGPTNPNTNPEPTCPDGTICPNADPYGYLKTQQNLALSENFGELHVPIGSVGFSAFNKNPWSVDIKGREYSTTSVIGTDANQRTYVYNKVAVTVDGKTYSLPITKAETKQEYPQAKWSWWNPRLSLGVSGGTSLTLPPVGEFTSSIGVNVFSYGQFVKQPDWTFVDVSVGYGWASRKPQILFTPFAYNIGKSLPLMNNVYIGPSVQVGTNGNFSISATIKVGL